MVADEQFAVFKKTQNVSRSCNNHSVEVIREDLLCRRTIDVLFYPFVELRSLRRGRRVIFEVAYVFKVFVNVLAARCRRF